MAGKALELDDAISFYHNMSMKTHVRDTKEFYDQVAFWLSDYKNIKDKAVREVESNMKCSCCGAKDLYEADLSVPMIGGTKDINYLRIQDSGDSDFPLDTSVYRARCCRRCGNIMPYIDIV